jgi:putative heme degradation protein
MENSMLTMSMSGPSRAAAAEALLVTKEEGQDPEGESQGGIRVWPLRPAWRSIVRAALARGPVTLRAGDSLCRFVQRASLRNPGPSGQDILANSGNGLEMVITGLACARATQSTTANGQARRGLAFFDHQGHAVLNVDLGDDASPDGFHDIVRRFSPGVAEDAVLDRDEPGQRPTMLGYCATACGWLARHQTVDRLDILLEQRAEADLAEPLPCEAILEVLRHAAHARIPMMASFACHGLRMGWTGSLLELGGRAGLAFARGLDTVFHWCEAGTGAQAWLVREPTSFGLVQSVALLAPDGGLRLHLQPAAGGATPQPCAWRTAINAARVGPCGSAC